jgi:hypothetical protein
MDGEEDSANLEVFKEKVQKKCMQYRVETAKDAVKRDALVNNLIGEEESSHPTVVGAKFDYKNADEKKKFMKEAMKAAMLEHQQEMFPRK